MLRYQGTDTCSYMDTPIIYSSEDRGNMRTLEEDDIVWISLRHSNWQGSTNLSFTNFQHLASQQSKKPLPLSARGQTPLHCAAVNGHDFTVERLLAAVANVNAVDNEGRGLGAGRVSTWILHKSVGIWAQNIIISVSICLNFKLIEIVVGCGGKRKVNKYIKNNNMMYKSYLLKYQGTDTCLLHGRTHHELFGK